MDYDMTNDTIGLYSIRPAAAFGSPRCGSGLAATLSRLCRPETALAETLAPHPLSLSDRHNAGAAPAVAPHPDVHLVEPAAVAPVPLRVGGGVSNTPIEAMSGSDHPSDASQYDPGHTCRRSGQHSQMSLR